MWMLRKALALSGSALGVALVFAFTDQDRAWTSSRSDFSELLAAFVLVLMFGFFPALLVTGLSDLLSSTFARGHLRFWVALLVHLQGIWPLLVMLDTLHDPWRLDLRNEHTVSLIAVLSFFILDELLNLKWRKVP